MSALYTQMYLMERYGPRLDLDQLAEALGRSKGTIYNQLAAGTFPIPTYLDGKRFAAVEDVAAHFERLRKDAHEAARVEG